MDILFKEKPVAMLLVLLHSKKVAYASSLSKQVNYTYSHSVKVLSTMEKEGLIFFEKHGRMKIIELTAKGKRVAEEIEKIKRITE